MPANKNEYEPITVYNFKDKGRFVLNDGYSRTYVAYINGITRVPVVIDEYDIVTCELGRKLYEKDIEWCDRFLLRSIKDLHKRIISHTDYERLWIERCDRSYYLIKALYDNQITDNLYQTYKDTGLSRDCF